MLLDSASGPVEIDDVCIKALQAKWKTRDVAGELAKMHLYLTRYPKRRPVRVWRFVDNWLDKAPAVIRPQTLVNAWWATDERTINQGAALGMIARPGETMAAFRDRISAAMGRAA